MVRRGILTAVAVPALALAVAACGSSNKTNTTKSTGGSGAGKPPIVIGDKNFPEENILGALYATALRAKGYKVTLKDNIGSTELTYKALTSGQIGMFPEYIGNIVSVIAGKTTSPPTAAATYQEGKAYLAQHGYALLAMTPFSDSDVVVTKVAYATAHHLTSVADLAKLGKSVKLAAEPEYATRFSGLIGLKKDYGVVPDFVPLATSALVYQAVNSGQVQAGDVFTTDPQLKSGAYTLLADPKGIFGFENVAPIVDTKLITQEGPAFASTLDKVSELLTLPAIQRMNAAVILDKQSPASVAEQFLKANGLA